MCRHATHITGTLTEPQLFGDENDARQWPIEVRQYGPAMPGNARQCTGNTPLPVIAGDLVYCVAMAVTV